MTEQGRKVKRIMLRESGFSTDILIDELEDRAEKGRLSKEQEKRIALLTDESFEPVRR